jgi:PAS domain S-box-containing protein
MKKCNILVVEDEALIAANLVHTLSSLGYTVQKPVANGEDAIRAVKTQKPDLVLMDIQLIGEMDGIVTAEKIRAIADIPIVYLTAHTDDLRLKRAQLTEPYGYIVKPTHSRELNATIDMAMYKHALDRKLKESEERYRTLVASVDEAIILQEKTGKILTWNSAAERLFGITISEVLGHTATGRKWKTIREDGTEFLDSEHPSMHTLATGEACKNVVMGITSAVGRFSWVNINTNPLFREGDAKPYAVVISLLDITERKLAEDALRESEQKFRYISELIPDFAYSCTKAPGGGFAIDWITGALEPITGYTTDEIKRMTCWKFLVIDEDIPVFEKNVTGLSPGESVRCELRIRRKDGVIIWLSSYAKCVTNLKEPEYHRLYGGCRNITNRKRADEALAESEGQKIAILNGITTNIAFVDKDLRLLWVNKFAAESVNKSPAEMIGHTCHALWADPAKPCENCPTLKVFETKQSEHTIMHTPDGRVWDKRGEPVLDEKGNLMGVVEIAQDITERKRAEEALRQANKQLNLLSGITRHDIHNQLLVLRGYLELSHDVIDKPEALKEFIKKEQQAANTINEQITFTRDYQELGAAAPKWQNVNEGIRNAMVALPMRAVHVEADPADPEVYADPLFEKVFYNLIDNALRYGGDQMKIIRVSSQESDTSLVIVCEDDGVGITDEDKKKLFRKGFGKHTGLGLFLSREILSITGITITENGTPGKGARFEIAVPKGMWRMNPDSGDERRGES